MKSQSGNILKLLQVCENSFSMEICAGLHQVHKEIVLPAEFRPALTLTPSGSIRYISVRWDHSSKGALSQLTAPLDIHHLYLPLLGLGHGVYQSLSQFSTAERRGFTLAGCQSITWPHYWSIWNRQLVERACFQTDDLSTLPAWTKTNTRPWRAPLQMKPAEENRHCLLVARWWNYSLT